jgi:hypothetical protein
MLKRNKKIKRLSNLGRKERDKKIMQIFLIILKMKTLLIGKDQEEPQNHNHIQSSHLTMKERSIKELKKINQTRRVPKKKKLNKNHKKVLRKNQRITLSERVQKGMEIPGKERTKKEAQRTKTKKRMSRKIWMTATMSTVPRSKRIQECMRWSQRLMMKKMMSAK